jgi:hypothetical protein
MVKIEISSAKAVLSLSPEQAIILFSLVNQHPAVIRLLRISSFGFYLTLLAFVGYFIQTRYKLNFAVEKKTSKLDYN